MPRWYARPGVRWVPVALLAACSSGSGPSSTAEKVLLVSGDAQDGSAGAILGHPLKVRVSDGMGQPVAGVPVAWSVIEGGGHVSSATVSTDQSGGASVTWTLGPVVGTQLVEARVGALHPAMFSATAGPPDPCKTPPPYTLGSTIEGTLAPGDCVLTDGSYVDYYSFSVPAMTARRFTLTSDSLDAFLFINTPAGVSLAIDNDGGGQHDASLRILLGPGEYQVAANSLDPGTRGPYTLASTGASLAVDSCADVWVTGGVNLSEQIETTDCVDPSGPYYSDELLLWLDIRQLITVAEHSADFDALVGLLDLSIGKIVATDDDSGPGRDALMTFTTTHAGEYVLIATTFLPDSTGAYTLTVSTPLADQAAPRPPAAASVENLLRLIRTRESRALRQAARTLLHHGARQ
ncbi:MAG TPA: Ig-like domain-containing protein [Gemmatimonadales bacterium]|nr:Ig-like domain-containing protein [Gemmatimonadales bacterium]